MLQELHHSPRFGLRPKLGSAYSLVGQFLTWTLYTTAWNGSKIHKISILNEWRRERNSIFMEENNNNEAYEEHQLSVNGLLSPQQTSDLCLPPPPKSAQKPVKTALLCGSFHSCLSTYGRSLLSWSSAELYQKPGDGKRGLPRWVHFYPPPPDNLQWLLTEWNRAQCWGECCSALLLAVLAEEETSRRPLCGLDGSTSCVSRYYQRLENAGSDSSVCSFAWFLARKLVIQTSFCLGARVHAVRTFTVPRNAACS